jgi:hypothetical protein
MVPSLICLVSALAAEATANAMAGKATRARRENKDMEKPRGFVVDA